MPALGDESVNHGRLHVYALLPACALVCGGIGAILALRLTSAQFAAVAALSAVAGALAWWSWR